MSILITGGAGFIGSNLVDKLIKLNKDVIVVDNLSSGDKQNINSRATLYNIDLIDNDLEEVFATNDIEYVIHLGAQVEVSSSINNPIKDSKTNIQGSINLFENCNKYNIIKVVYASSAAVYGDPIYLPINEDHPIRAMSPYGVSKYTPEKYLRYYNHEHGLDYTILRYSNVYGPRQSSIGEGGVIAIFIDRMLKNKRPIIYGDGKQSRDFIHVYDVVNANINALQKANRKKINISTRSETTINRVVKIINGLLDIDLSPLYEEKRKGDIRHSILDNSSAYRYLDWEPEYSIKEGLKQTIEYYLNQRDKKL